MKKKMNLDRTDILDRAEEVKMVFNIVGSGFGEEIDDSIKNKKCVAQYIMGQITRDELVNALLNDLEG